MRRVFGKYGGKAFVCVLLAGFLASGMTLCAQAVPARGTKQYSEDEQAYIDRKKVLEVAVVDDWLPIAAWDKEDGTCRGLAIDILKRFQEQTGMEVKYVKAGSYMDAIRMAEAGTVNIAAVVTRYPNGKNPYGVDITIPYLESSMMLIHRKDTDLADLSEYIMAEVDGYPVLSVNPMLKHVTFDSPNECLVAVRSGHADIFYSNIYTGMAYTQRYENRELVAIPVNTTVQLHFGIGRGEDPFLRSLLNQTIADMDRGDINQSLTRNRRDVKGGLGDFVYRYPFEIICAVIAAAFLLILVVTVTERIKSRKKIVLHGYTNSYRLMADTFGEAGLNYDYMEDKLTVFGKYADQLILPAEIEAFSTYLEREDRAISLTKEQFQQLLIDGMTGEAYDTELECKTNSGEWQHFWFTFSVASTDESYRRPICMVGCLVNEEEEHLERERLLQLGLYDKLTSLLNRAGGENAVKEHLESGILTSEDLLLVMDVDNFKMFNDTQGHDCGDGVLIELGRQMKRVFRKDDILCRWGGDEFLLYLIGAASHIELIEERCGALQNAMRAYQYEGRQLPVTVSIGGTVVGDRSQEEAFRRADQALYRAKKQGKASVWIERE